MDLPVSVLTQVAATLDRLGIQYVLVGSFASSIHGMYRATADIDILADVKAAQVQPLLEILQTNFYVDEHAVRDAVSRHSSFNAIHLDSVFKVDIFIAKNDEFAQSQLQRRQLRRFSDNNAQVYVASAEDTVLAKLKWYRSGAEVSRNQWTDVVGILGIHRTDLDTNYLRIWAEKLGLTDMLEKALAESK